MSGGIAVMEAVKRRVSYDQLRTIVDVPAAFLGKEIEITLSDVDDEDEQIFSQLHGCASNIRMTAEEARAERLSQI